MSIRASPVGARRREETEPLSASVIRSSVARARKRCPGEILGASRRMASSCARSRIAPMRFVCGRLRGEGSARE